MEEINLSSFYTKIYRLFLISIILLNVIGIVFIKFLIPNEKSENYDLSLNFGLIMISIFIFVISINLVNEVSFDSLNKNLIVKNFGKKIIINSNDIIRVEKVFPTKCRIVFKKNNIQKSILFIPNIPLNFSFSNYTDEIEKLLKN